MGMVLVAWCNRGGFGFGFGFRFGLGQVGLTPRSLLHGQTRQQIRWQVIHVTLISMAVRCLQATPSKATSSRWVDLHLTLLVHSVGRSARLLSYGNREVHLAEESIDRIARLGHRA